jgi:hypothetical protein
LDLENTKTRALIGEWANKAKYRDAATRLGFAKYGLDLDKYGRYANDMETFAKGWMQNNPDGTQEQLTSALTFKFPEIFAGKDPEKSNVISAPVVGTPATKPLIGTGKPRQPGMYEQKTEAQQAQEWVNANPNDSRVPAIRKQYGF